MKERSFYCMRFYVTYRCNSRCRYCNVWQDKRFRISKELTLEEAKSLIRQCYEVGVRYIDFTGGEPTLYKNLVELIQYARSLGIKTEVTTNGISYLTGRLPEIARCTEKFNISLDTLDRETYWTIRGVDSLGKVIETIDEIQEIRCPKIMMVVSKDNIAELRGMIAFAQQKKAEIYLNPEFSYFDGASSEKAETFIDQIMEKIYEPYTVVMLHFMEFYRNVYADGRPPCSANVRTLTFAPDGALILPCYHDLQETIPWKGNLAEMLASECFQVYSKENEREKCRCCTIIPYFGISFNYRLNKYFLIQSYSEKLHHLKRDFLNQINEQREGTDCLLSQLQEFIRVVRSLCVKRHTNDTWLYWVEKTKRGYITDIYSRPLSEAQYRKEREAQDCWQLELVPHTGFDEIYERVYKKLFALYLSGTCLTEITELFKAAAEFQLRWWKWFISQYMSVSVICDIRSEALWLQAYLLKISKCGNRLGDESIVRTAEKLSHMIDGVDKAETLL